MLVGSTLVCVRPSPRLHPPTSLHTTLRALASPVHSALTLSVVDHTVQDLAYLINERDQERRRGGTASEQIGKIRGGFNTLERLLTSLEKTQREVEEAPAQFKL